MIAVVIASVIGGACGSLAVGVSGLALAVWQSRRSDRWRQ